MQFRQVEAELLELEEIIAKGEGVPGGAEANSRVGVFHGLTDNGDATKDQALQFHAGQVAGFLAKAGEFVAEVGGIQPSMQSGQANAGVAGGLGQGGGHGDKGQSSARG